MVLLEVDGTPLAETDVLRTAVLNAKLADQASMMMNVKLQDGREVSMRLPL